MFFKFKYYFLAFVVLFSTIIIPTAQATKFSYDVAPATSRVKFTYSLTTAIPFISANTFYDSNYRGQDSYVVIIDTGVETTHPFFQNRVALEACFAAKCPNGNTSMVGVGAAKPVHWHGTHVAGIAAGYNSSIHGVAPEAKIIAVNVFDSSGAAYDDDIVRALNWVNSISSQYNITSINMSLGGSTTYLTTCDNYLPDMTSVIRSLRDKNIATVIASGNDYAHGMSAPACISYAVSVAAMYTNTTSITNFSNINSYTTIAAPGSSINSSKTSASYGLASGTSMATPFVTGAFAAYRSKYGIKSVTEVVNHFRATTKRALDSYTKISIPYLDFSHLTDSPVVTTTTTLPSTTTSTSTTIPSVTTTIPQTTTTSTTQPPTVTTTTNPVVSRPVYEPYLNELDAHFRKYVLVYYRDPRFYVRNVSYYILSCNDSLQYIIPKTAYNGYNVYKLNVSPKILSACAMQSVSYDGSKSSFTDPVKVTPKAFAKPTISGKLNVTGKNKSKS